eukprot:Gb_22726 [translate_table: standard]
MGGERDEEERDRSSEASISLLSSESRWVDGSEMPSDSPRSEADGEFRNRRRLVKRTRRVDSFDVEAMQVPGAHRTHAKDLSFVHTLGMALQSLGVVYGDLGTSPLYVFSSVFSEASIKGDEDVLGALSLVMYTIAIIPLTKYVFIVLKANDNGEGGTFSLYSLISRYAKVNLLPNQLPSDEKISSFKLKLPTPELERALKIKESLEKRSSLKTLLLLLVLLGTSMIIGDGILTPAISVMSAVSGLQDQISGFDQDAVVIVSIIFLVILFSIQRFGTSKVGLVFAPALSIWFFSLASVGLYNIFSHDVTVFRAFNPVYIYYFFKRNTFRAWRSLGGCVLCITGAEAMFADVGHFSVRSIQIAFTCVVFPCLLLAYMGQAAYLMKNPTKVDRAFYSSIPGKLLQFSTLMEQVLLSSEDENFGKCFF